MATDTIKCDACGINARQVIVGDTEDGWRVCFTCIAEFVKETDATPEAFDWWVERARKGV